MPKPPLSLEPVNEGVYRVLDAQGQHLGNLKRIGTVWKFKAVGYTALGAPEPGGGPLTHRHNTTFEQPDAVRVGAELLGEGQGRQEEGNEGAQ